MLAQIRPAIVSMVFFTLLLGLAYPLGVTGVAQLAFPRQADGSLIRDASGKIVGSALIGQAFASPAYLNGRPSAAGKGYDASASSGSNLGPLNPDLIKREREAAAAIRKADGDMGPLPADAVTTSGSGLDPHISPAYARLQAGRIALARGVAPARVHQIIEAHVERPYLGFIGQPRVNVLQTNLDLDAALGKADTRPR
jgi:potassium-transporting ATPase KdpC subunit